MLWELSLRERPATFTGQTVGDKLFIRLNGRIVTPPITAAEQERLFWIDGELLRLRRDGQSVELEVVPPEDAADDVHDDVADAAPDVAYTFNELSYREEPPASVVIRARVYFAAALLILIVACSVIARTWQAREMVRRWDTRPIINQDQQSNPAAMSRMERASSILMTGYLGIAYFAIIGMAAAALLARGFRWSPLVLESVTWLMFILLGLTYVRVHRVMHVQLHSAHDPVAAAQLLSRVDGAAFVALAIVALMTGGLLHLVRQSTVDALYDE